jgi:hypothetical protein
MKNGPRERDSSRRTLLKALGLSAALAPFVPHLNRMAEAASPSPFPRRLLLAFAPNGTVEDRFWPVGGETAFTFPAGQITEPLAPFAKQLLFARNLTRPDVRGGGPHEVAMGSLWTGSSLNADPGGMNGYGFAKSASIDQIIAAKLAPPTAFPTLELSVAHNEQLGGDTDPTTKYMIYAGPNTPKLPNDNPYQVLSMLMVSGQDGGTGPLGPDAMADARAEKKSVIDLVLAELDVLGRKVDAEDRQKVDAHVAGLRDIEKRLEATATAPGATCANPAVAPGYDRRLYDNDSFPALVTMQNDLAVAALACDRTRIASVQWSRTFSMLRHTWLASNAPPHHTNSHETTPEAVDWQYKMSRWYCQQLSYLLGKLAAVKEGNGTLLDNTLVVWAYDMNLGAGHVLAPHVAVLAGGVMNTGTNGRLVDFGGKYDWTQMLVTICHAMGATDVSSVGDLGRSGEIPGLLRT